jgi:hypothetical protein
MPRASIDGARCCFHACSGIVAGGTREGSARVLDALSICIQHQSNEWRTNFFVRFSLSSACGGPVPALSGVAGVARHESRHGEEQTHDGGCVRAMAVRSEARFGKADATSTSDALTPRPGDGRAVDVVSCHTVGRDKRIVALVFPAHVPVARAGRKRNSPGKRSGALPFSARSALRFLRECRERVRHWPRARSRATAADPVPRLERRPLPSQEGNRSR